MLPFATGKQAASDSVAYNSFAQLEVHITRKSVEPITNNGDQAAATPSQPPLDILKIKKNHAFKGIRNLPMGDFEIAIVYSNYKTKETVSISFPVAIEDSEDVKVFKFVKDQSQESVDASSTANYKGVFVEETNQEVIDKYYQLATTGALHETLIDFAAKKKKQKQSKQQGGDEGDAAPAINENEVDDEDDEEQNTQQDYFLASQMDMLLNDFDKRTQSKKFNDGELQAFEQIFQEFMSSQANKNSANSSASGSDYDKYAQQIRDHYVLDSEVLKEHVSYYKQYAKALARHVKEWPGIRKHNELMSYVGYLIEDLAEIGETAASKELAASIAQ